MTTDKSLATRCVHAGELDDPQGSPHTPIYNTTTFRFPNTAAVLDVVEGRVIGNLYTRYGLNPSIRSLEAKLAELEGAEGALAFASGMAAESALLFSHGREGVICIGDAYGGTLELIADQLPQLGITTHLLLGSELEQLEPLLEAGVRLVFMETPSNPTLELFDIAAIANHCHRHGALLVVDNTFASPVNQQPLALGADLVVHSATKYLGGHSDLTAGALMGRAELLDPVWGWRKNLGQMLAPETASQLSRSLRTLVIRVQQQNTTATAIAQAMDRHPRVARVLYPGLSSFPQYALAQQQMSGPGGMLTLELDGDTAMTSAVVDRLRLFYIAASLGGVESLVTQPVTTTHHGLDEAERRRRGISGAMVRLSVGLESAEELIADLEYALGSE